MNVIDTDYSNGYKIQTGEYKKEGKASYQLLL